MKQLFIAIVLLAGASAQAQPGWQQKVNTKIDARLDDKKFMVYAYEEITYTNNSPDTLKSIYMHLWPNAYKNDKTPFAKQMDLIGKTDFYFSKTKDRGYIDSLSFVVDGQSVDHYKTEDRPDIARVDLINPLLPGQTIKISTPFKVKIPQVFSRSGHTGEAFYLAQWFPKPAVYDNHGGWHPLSYQELGEFYSEYGSYDVSITLPANYVVMATGNCTDDKENEWLEQRAKDNLPADTTYSHHFPASASETKTIHFHEDNIHDFAWFADKRFVVRKDTVTSPGNGQMVTVWAAFLPAYRKQWIKATDYLRETILSYGKLVGPYPYKTMKAALGDMKAGGGMEYPTVTLIDKAGSSSLRKVTVHEAGHNWFYGLLGSNESDHAWMDEGLNTFYEQKTTRDLSAGKKKSGLSKLDESLIYYEMAATHMDQALEQTSANFRSLNYGLDVYYKTALLLNWLEQYMGANDFGAGMKDYFDTWHFHHPYPEDFKACLQKHTSKNLDWFFDTLLNSDKKIDYTITKATVAGANTEITIRNNTGVAAPALVNAYNKDSLTGAIWTPPFTHTAKLTLPTANWTKLTIDDAIPDAKTTNNRYRRNGLSHRLGLSIQSYAGVNRSYNDKLYIAPALGYTLNDGFMAGLLFHNYTLPQNRLRFALAPTYAFGSSTMNGGASVGYIWYPNAAFKEIMLQADASTYHHNETLIGRKEPLYARYMKVAPSLTFTLNEPDALSTVNRELTLKAYSINEQTFGYTATETTLKDNQKLVETIRYTHKNNRTFNPFSYQLLGEYGPDYGKISAEGTIRIDYDRKKKSLYVRAYAGKFFDLSEDPAKTEQYRLNTSFSGVNDYLYDGVYIGRNAQTGLAAHQIAIQEGGFKVPIYNNTGRSDNWIATINLKTDLPLRNLPIRLFLDAGLMPNPLPDMKNPGATTLQYDAGVEVHVLKDLLNIYFPIVLSSDFRNYLDNTYGRKNVFQRSISFSLNLQQVNWLKAPAKLLYSSLN